jgi:outer membrane receptor protein involved in Fe transport
MRRRTYLLAAASLWALAGGMAAAQTNAPAADQPVQKPASAKPAPAPQEIVVTAQRLNSARASIQPSLGATVYTVTDAAIQALPGADNQQLNQVVLQLPGVVQDGFGQLHVRDDHNGIQYRLNGVILPEGISVFGQTLSPRLVGRLDLLTGALPAQYGLRTAGIIDITTKSGLFQNGGEASIYGGSHGTYEPSGEYGGSVGDTNYFVSADFKRNQLGIENVQGTKNAIHDRTDQGNLFAYVDRNIGENDRISFIGGYSNQRFQIPNPSGLEPSGTYSLNGSSTYPSEDLNERQRETTGYAIGSWLHDQGKVTLQTSLFARYSTLTYYPDTTGELLYNGQAENAAKQDTAFGLQSEGVYRLNDAHTLRAGVIVQAERGTSKTSTLVYPNDAAGDPIGTATPFAITDDSGKNQYTYTLYLQDEWKLTDKLTLNYGLRGDDVNGYRDEMQLSPRVNLVWLPLQGTTVHLGYARYFVPPPFELVSGSSTAKFVGTSAEPGTAPGDPAPLNTAPYAERQNYYDIGAQQKFHGMLSGLTLGLDTWYRTSHNLIDEGQFGAPIILTPFNYARGTIKGVELSASYAKGPLSLYTNFTAEKAQGQNIVSSQFSFDPGDLAYIANHPIYLDHDQTYTASAGATYKFDEGTQLGVDALYGSGLRTDGAVPNGNALADYIQVNFAVSQKLTLPVAGKMEARLDVINLFDKVYEIRDGTGVGVGAPEYGPRRGVFVGLTKYF